MVVHEGAAHLNGLAYGAKLSGAVARHNQRVRIVIRVGALGCESRG